ncbi:probable ubiquitin-conjugating enzyme E2 23 [Primulina huaijiensis]|uniref:probable ubiquitin-conjugating enzyme E2 23 n=1 Tax=Primulina huaijiensis TaxID=1492673 RepID=UPI003CC792DC
MESQRSSDPNEPTTTTEDDTIKQCYSTCESNRDPDLSYENRPGEVLRNLQNVSYIYRHDVVSSKINNKIGIVTEVAGDSDSDSIVTDDDDEEDGDERDDEAGSKEECYEERNKNSDENSTGKFGDNDSKHGILSVDQVRVSWLEESETKESTNDVTVIDRGFLQGDYVAGTLDPTGQIGIVVDISTTVDLLMHDGSVLKDQSSKDLKRIREFTVGDHVVLGPWLGRIEDVSDNVTVLFDDGSICKVMNADPLRLKPAGKNILEDGHFPYYPGQRVKASSSSVFKNSRWLSGLWKANRLEGTVTNVAIGSVFIYWIASAGYGPDSDNTPDEEQSPKNLKLLSCFAHTIWQLGDWCLLPLAVESSLTLLDKEPSKLEAQDFVKYEQESAETDDNSDAEMATNEELTGNGVLMQHDSEALFNKNIKSSENSALAGSSLCSSVTSLKEAVHETWPLHRKKIRKVVVRKDKKARKKVENFERALLIINTKTKVDVAWQDGTIKLGMDSTSLIPIDSLGDHEFVAEQYVVEKAADDSNDATEIRRVGVVKSVNGKERTSCVRWLKPVMRAEDPREFDREEVASVYELEGHPDYDYCYGDVVVRLSPVTFPTKTFVEDSSLNSSHESKHDEGKNRGNNNIENNSAHDMSSEFSDLSWVGNITGLKDGDIEVTWADGMISSVGPQEIYVVGRDDNESIAAASGASDDAASWETVEDDNIESIDDDKEDPMSDNSSDAKPDIEDSNLAAENSGKNGALSIPLAALGFMTRIASGIFSRGRKDSDSMELNIKSEDDFHLDGLTSNKDPCNGSSSQKLNDIEDKHSKLSIDSKGEEHNTKASDLLEVAETLCHLKLTESNVSLFKGFDIVTDPFDHYFSGAPGQNSAARKWLKKVQQDWNILQNNLPEGIYVRAYEDRMDLLRAVIVGAYGTPYQDGLFFFDFQLPPEYPDVPPSAYYYSGGWRINPNLYEEGKVCLSLLNTWTGRGNEVWHPSTSSILQVLVSLQGLVLNSKPYFNEAGYDKQVGTAEGEKNSLSYNENTFLLNCKTMMYLIRKPPKDFEVLVFEHFRKRGYYILKACDAYMKGHLIGSLTRDASVSNDSNSNLNSIGFKLMLAKVVPKLFNALTGVGAKCQEFQHLQPS